MKLEGSLQFLITTTRQWTLQRERRIQSTPTPAYLFQILFNIILQSKLRSSKWRKTVTSLYTSTRRLILKLCTQFINRLDSLL